MKQIKRGFGNEIFLTPSAASSAKIIGVYPIDEALSINNRYSDLLPTNEGELQNIYELAHKGERDELV
jgi:hypothetical protein